ncbi:hypothetical protein ACFQI3_11590 [Hansschlegelia quercus]|uniref:Uncharacterized protein n=1 Tax=Hansschlegelia quercus TaxID=2528245 RepID=A0A4V2JE15_9HYPH|nr:hypothetical protein [Hansschlegelia quercus]TBN53496.1 hypothetical protein EYR15_10845 [Hansschlegelia quercus]
MTQVDERGLARLKLLWPGHRAALHARWSLDPHFRELCEAYELAHGGLEHWVRQHPAPRERVEEYKELIDATEQDLIEIIDSSTKEIVPRLT